MSGYDPDRRSPRGHRRVVRRGTERFDADGVRLEPSDRLAEDEKSKDDQDRILGELPPHWAVFKERE